MMQTVFRLKAYQWEHETFPEFQNVQVCSDTQQKLVRKLARHFKTPKPALQHTRINDTHGRYIHPNAYHASTIRTAQNSTLGTLCHEFAHHLAYLKHGRGVGHDKRFKKQLKKVYTFAKRYIKHDKKEDE